MIILGDASGECRSQLVVFFALIVARMLVARIKEGNALVHILSLPHVMWPIGRV